MGIRQFISHLRMRSSELGGMDKDSIEDKKNIEGPDDSPGNPSANAGSGSIDVAVADEQVPADMVGTQEEARVSGPKAEEGSSESAGADSSPQSSATAPTEVEDKALVPLERFKQLQELILKQFRDVLAVAGLQPIRAIGSMFDPNYHQAVIREENNGLAENEIIEELQRGYVYKDRLLRPSMVKVAVPAASETPEQDPEQDES